MSSHTIRDRLCLALAGFVLNFAAHATADQPRGRQTADSQSRPRLMVVVSVDQFPFLYQERLKKHLGDKGFFARARNEGAFFVDCHHPHANTRTGPGHSVLLTGAHPGETGIIDNAWFDRVSGKKLYCVQDDEAISVGILDGKKLSPKNLAVGTLGDQMKLVSGGKAKVFGVGLKDRAAILMAGHAADGAIWYDAKTPTNSGRWVSCNWYYPDLQLPKYLELYNNEALSKKYGGGQWKLKFDDATMYEKFYEEDDAEWEQDVEVLGRKFPHDIPELGHKKFPDLMPISPRGSEMTLEIARLVAVEEKLGKDDVCDLLCINLSSNDFCGHAYGPYSLEVQDMTYQTDEMLEKFTQFLDEQVGAGQWTLALSSDHGVAPVPEHASQLLGITAKRVLDPEIDKMRTGIESALVAYLGTPDGGAKYLLEGENEQASNSVLLNTTLPQLAGAKFSEAQRIVRDKLLADSNVAAAYTRDEILAGAGGQEMLRKFQLSFNAARSGDVVFCLKPYYIEGKTTANHGSPWNYDSHVTLLFVGAGVTPGVFERRVAPAMIAPTAARIMGVPEPAACSVPPLYEAIGGRNSDAIR